MSKRIKKLIILALVVIALIIACLFVSSLDKQEKEPIPDDEPIVLASLDIEALTSVEYSYAGTALSFSCKSGQWSLDSDPEFPLTQNILTTMISDVALIKATRKLSDSEDPSVYGFDVPSLTVRFKTTDSEYYFEIGDSNSYNGGYYLRYNGEIYVTDETIVTTFSKNLYDYLTTTDLPELENIVSFTIDSKEITDADTVNTLSQAFMEIKRGNVADYRSKESYGFDGTEHKVLVKYQKDNAVTDSNGNAISTVTGEYSYSFEFSQLDDNYYIMLADDSLIYSAEGLDSFLVNSD